MPKIKSTQEKLLDILEDWRELSEKYGERARRQIGKLGRLAIWEWYKTYSPKLYNRRRTLYYGFKVSGKGGVIDIHFGSEDMYKIHYVDRIDENYIFENSFMLGYHGGAIDGENHPNPGVPYWRTPPPHYPYWSFPAARSKSPYDRINEEIDKYEIKTRKNITSDFRKKIYPKLIKLAYG